MGEFQRNLAASPMYQWPAPIYAGQAPQDSSQEQEGREIPALKELQRLPPKRVALSCKVGPAPAR